MRIMISWLMKPADQDLLCFTEEGIQFWKTKCIQCTGFDRLEKHLNLEGFLEKSLKINSALKSTGNHSKALKSP